MKDTLFAMLCLNQNNHGLQECYLGQRSQAFATQPPATNNIRIS